MKVMMPEGSLQMDVPAHCTIVYCKWEVPSFYDELVTFNLNLRLISQNTTYYSAIYLDVQLLIRIRLIDHNYWKRCAAVRIQRTTLKDAQLPYYFQVHDDCWETTEEALETHGV